MVRGNQIVDNARGLLLDGSSANRFLDNTLRANDTAVDAVLERRAQQLRRQPVRRQLERSRRSAGATRAHAGPSTAGATSGAAIAASTSTATASATRRIRCSARSSGWKAPTRRRACSSRARPPPDSSWPRASAGAVARMRSTTARSCGVRRRLRAAPTPRPAPAGDGRRCRSLTAVVAMALYRRGRC